MSEQSDSGEKTHDATPKRLKDARRKGEIARSPDMLTAVAYAGFLVALTLTGAAGARRLVDVGAGLLQNANAGGQVLLGGGRPMSAHILTSVLLAIIPWMLGPALAVFLAIVATRGLVFTPDRLLPKLSRLSILTNAKNKYGRSGLFEFAKAFTKLWAIAFVLGLFLVANAERIAALVRLEPRPALAVLGALLLAFIARVVIVAAVIGAIDFLWQYREYLRRNRMSRQEVLDEHKHDEGDPHMKQQRRQRGYGLAMNQMIEAVAEADVVVVNPTHFAVALKWDRRRGTAPVCVAKGVDEIARRIRERAAQAGVPVQRDPSTARALYATVGLGDEIRPEHYRAVAAAIRFAEAMRVRAARKRGWR